VRNFDSLMLVFVRDSGRLPLANLLRRCALQSNAPSEAIPSAFTFLLPQRGRIGMH
jgi:hypothetical protein